MKPALRAAALAAAIFLAQFELETDDTGVEVGLILGISFVLGWAHPRRAWQWALLIGGSVPVAELAARHQAMAGVAAFTIGLGLAGSYAGAGVRRAACRIKTPMPGRAD